MNLDLQTILYTGAIGLIVIGISGIVMSRHLFRILLALVIAESGANLLLVLSGFRWDAVAPIINAATPASRAMVDPVPQAMVLTAIVIGVGIQALAVSLILTVYHAWGTLDMDKIHGKLDSEISRQAGIAPSRSGHGPLGGRPLPPPEQPARTQQAQDRA